MTFVGCVAAAAVLAAAGPACGQGAAVAWGSNEFSQLGDGTLTPAAPRPPSSGCPAG